MAPCVALTRGIAVYRRSLARLKSRAIYSRGEGARTGRVDATRRFQRASGVARLTSAGGEAGCSRAAGTSASFVDQQQGFTQSDGKWTAERARIANEGRVAFSDATGRAHERRTVDRPPTVALVVRMSAY